ncbi:dynein light chain, Tctex-1 domain containing protein [Monocercomonoides exilis]|uniref:dynein light chain, Tctex-1 domain containing protein n=1 Tax=Monocercomonoides exilis TaxID=2049356 RepID=UPI00355AC2C3|nr:dynein light chain, Tctex-1 domain containing protein [Monocercomonoides exilis]|eukprot:MONOS_3805.1-p1 / transcript=MONOS_3805.1 / gene=MONOS_3805 / organism=Monocercomonoides_exilis_PA203 / gene_product=dynein light chain, Tctex-1 domain containing protein / transcript_product=dynein light chain, Tctex-1 domain containing protein / location=Mono_scaffold00093:52686-53216(-) / protein_length=113 / sequence_SO=supercontig / SO=protein_coding / is_pseudo=false
MEDLQSSEEAVFPVDDVRNVVKETVQKVLENQYFEQEKVPEWVDTINSMTVKKLCALQTPFKYIVTTVIMEKKLANLHCSCSALWDNVNDGNFVHPWENKNLFCLTTVFGVQI